MEECGIYRNNTKGYSTGWEAGGLKVTMSRGFVFDHCRVVDNRGPGVWYDIGNERAEVANCYIADNDEGGIFYEISYGLHAHHNLIVNNANLGQDPGRAWGMGGITLSSSEDCIIEHNTLAGNRDGIAFREQDRNTPRIGQRDEVRIFNRNHVIRQNIIANSGAYNVALWFDMPFFDRRPGKGAVDPATLNIKFENNLLWPLGGRPNYLFGASWKAKSKACITPADCTMASSIADTSLIADPLFINPAAGDFHVRETSPAIPLKAGAGNNSPGKR